MIKPLSEAQCKQSSDILTMSDAPNLWTAISKICDAITSNQLPLVHELVAAAASASLQVSETPRGAIRDRVLKAVNGRSPCIAGNGPSSCIALNGRPPCIAANGCLPYIAALEPIYDLVLFKFDDWMIWFGAAFEAGDAICLKELWEIASRHSIPFDTLAISVCVSHELDVEKYRTCLDAVIALIPRVAHYENLLLDNLICLAECYHYTELLQWFLETHNQHLEITDHILTASLSNDVARIIQNHSINYQITYQQTRIYYLSTIWSRFLILSESKLGPKLSWSQFMIGNLHAASNHINYRSGELRIVGEPALSEEMLPMRACPEDDPVMVQIPMMLADVWRSICPTSKSARSVYH